MASAAARTKKTVAVCVLLLAAILFVGMAAADDRCPVPDSKSCVCSKNCDCAGACVMDAKDGDKAADIRRCFVQCVLRNDCFCHGKGPFVPQ